MPTTTTPKYLDFAQIGKHVVNLTHHIQAYDLAFAEGDRFLVEDEDTLADVDSLLKAKNKAGFDRLTGVYLNSDNTFSGIVEDDISPQISKRYAFKITGKQLQYRLINPQAVENFTESQLLEFATATALKGKKPKQAKCVKGVPCDPICLRSTYICLHDLTPGQKKIFDRAVRKANDARLRAEQLKGTDKELQAQANLAAAEKTLEKKTRQVGLARERNQAKAANTKPTPDDADFPADISALKTIRKLGGSTGATLVEDSTTGKQYVIKRGASADHIRSESAADKAYEALGIDVPSHKLYETPDGPVKLAQFIEGRTANQLTGTERELVAKQLQKHFVADALLGNWDVVGLNSDNLMVSNDGKVYRLDNGGALGFRAQGERKQGNQWNEYPTELWSMRDTNIASTASFFKGLTYKEITDQMEAIAKSKKELLEALPDKERAVVEKRITEIERLAKISRTFEQDQWNDDYTEGFSKHVIGLREAGITAKLPQSLTQKSQDKTYDDFVFVVDENGKDFDNLRGSASIINELSQYTAQAGGDHEKVITKWLTAQSSSSWSTESTALKVYLQQQRSIPAEDYYWMTELKDDYKKKVVAEVGEDVYRNSVQVWQAFNYELLDKADFKGKNAKNGTVELIRTENSKVLEAYGLNPGDENVLMKRGTFDSASLYRSVSVYGNQTTIQQVPIHRILGTYWTSKSPGSHDGGFLNDNENEVVAMLGGIPFKYAKGTDYHSLHLEQMKEKLKEILGDDFTGLPTGGN